MIKVGITGGIGSGKSTVCKYLEKLNYPVYYADERAKWIINNDPDCKNRVISEFGEKSFSNGKLNREYLGETVFKSKEKTQKLNSIVHPLVALDFQNWINKQDSEIIFKEAALMFETESWKQLDKIILVTAPQDLRIERVLKRDSHRNREQILNIISKQLPEEEKAKKADFIIQNIDLESLEKQLSSTLENIKKELD